MRLWTAVLFVALSSAVIAQVPALPVPLQTPRDAGAKTGTSRLSGRVTSLETGKPIRRAVVV